ncbi:TPA: hypothetical protein L4942_000176 [Pseudomonas aeruginosa]|uniref:Uncharacterized protein n=7 Tax=root TaxID=1 RepID=A0A2K8HL79_9CAUD|nr:hypothetical protein [Pseudomonas aeruginosa]YP_010765787.1 hypothetical protein QGM56_gp28 [Pseudomonas phage vB_PaeP_E220]ASZ72168.1 hypothetical protein vBPaePE220_00028 [Pseudomonas phage vB_PaeP_E220]ELV1372787.1 hypothetical protein [Pseudomonas aeruginosa]MUH78604.1 hypothetical protein [Pseudomonas aeruginosa]RQF49542.1 hypothetical protein IPC264_24105 [Pseudomonas aeruginosa]HBO4142218.1 hypothetical protein [Pseudomonas aeruginosa]
MATTSLVPLAGINNVAEDAALQRGGESPRLYVRDAVNIDLSPAGKAQLRASARQVTDQPFRQLWQSPLHGDAFGALGDQWGKVDPHSWTFEPLAQIGEGDLSHEVLNNRVCVAGTAGIFTYDGAQAERLTLDTPAPPLLVAGAGSLSQGTYGAAVAWLRGPQESAPSLIAFADVTDAGALEVTFPLCLDASVTGARLYLTRANGGELLLAGDYPLGAATLILPTLPELGRPAQFRHLSPMPTGKHLAYWRGRLLTARANVLRFSEALAYHLHDERYGFVQMPQRITFVQPVDGGIWVGQVDHVAFLDGADPASLSVSRRASRAPVPGSAVLVPAEVVGTNASPDGSPVAVWLAENGYVMGTSSGAIAEVHAGVLAGITGRAGTSVVFDRRLLTAVS